MGTGGEGGVAGAAQLTAADLLRGLCAALRPGRGACDHQPGHPLALPGAHDADVPAGAPDLERAPLAAARRPDGRPGDRRRVLCRAHIEGTHAHICLLHRRFSQGGEMERPLVSVYITCHNYGRYLEQAVESVLAQSLQNWELIIVDDASSDETPEICQRYQEQDPQRIRVLRHEEAQGLQRNANRVLEMARGKYIMRLDADDWLDESALLVMSERMERRAEVALVYPNYFYVDAEGRFLGVEQRKLPGSEARLLDLPAHGACTMVRRRVLKALGGYDERHNAQDGYELWLKVSRHYAVEGVATPLFFYRQHPESLSRNEDRLLTARRQIKRSLAEKLEGAVKPRVVGIVPAKNTYKSMPDVVLKEVGGRPLIDHTLEAARASGRFDEIWVTTDCPRVVEHCTMRDIPAMLRPSALSEADRKLSEVVYDAVTRLETDHDLFADVVVVLSAHSPLRRAEHITKALDTLVLYDADSVISVYEDFDMHFQHGADGLEPLNPAMMRKLRLEREGLYVFNGAITAVWRDAIRPDDYHGKSISHVVMPWRESFQLKSDFDRWMLDRLLREDNEDRQEPPTAAAE
ncbi:glycosyltransferase family 2 protein [Lujinxingia vulgaris]|uniref:Glycosyltransferase family 2 protein n=2 Tax=Lujinxingia vulgaris TaxID=2600176 RepID=A0A5C6X692_9DELT|nr:glycosyltransferase family 2 protein [Lujinxingia vulgaris]